MTNERLLFLDDVRPAPEGWDVVRSYDEFVDWITRLGVPLCISFDHDLADEHYPGSPVPPDEYKEKTGYDCVKWMLETCDHVPRTVIVHSFNPVGARRIADALRDECLALYIRPYKLPYPKLT